MFHDRKLIGRNLRHVRLALHLTQKETARRAGLSLSFYQKLERCEAGLSLPTLWRLCEALFVYPSDLFSDDPATLSPRVPLIARAISDLPPDRQKPILDLIDTFLRGR